MLSAIKKFFLWNYVRNTWQWDILCVVILVFIFMTPKSCFENGERRSAFPHQSPTASTLLVGPELIDNAQDRGQVEQRMRAFTGRNDIKVLDVRKVIDKDGKPKVYEVDIR